MICGSPSQISILQPHPQRLRSAERYTQVNYRNIVLLPFLFPLPYRLRYNTPPSLAHQRFTFVRRFKPIANKMRA